MIALLDGDVFCHLACKSRNLNLKGQHVVSLDTPEFNKADDREYLEDSWDNFKKLVASVLEICWAEDYLMAVKHEDNFRDHIYPEYKLQRRLSPNGSNTFVPILRKLAVAEDYAIEAIGREADDMLRIWAEQARLFEIPYVIVSIDKDLKCIPGKHYNIKKNELTTVTELFATRFFYQQLMSGDPTDNVPGIPGIGHVKAEKYLYNLSEEDEMQSVVVEQYMNAFGSGWYDQLLSNGKMLYIQKHEHDYFKVSDWPIVKFLGVPEISQCRDEKRMQEASAASQGATTAASPMPPPLRPVAPQPAMPASKPANVSKFTGVVPKIVK